MKKSRLNSQQILEGVAQLHTKDIDLGLDRFQTLLAGLGNPQDQFPPVIHVAGTNGKGSTIAFLRAVFETVGYVVHCFTSPHFLRPHECITLAGEEISEDQFSDDLNEVLSVNKDAPLTVFEAISAAAFLGFSRTRAHVVLLETGLGGIGDTTNVVNEPALTVLTPISYDHQEFLGDTLAEIAMHKAGILKPGVPCVMAKQDEEAYQSIRERVKELDVPFYRQGREWFVKKAGNRMVFEGWDGDKAYPLPGLIGAHQIDNAGLALACLEVLKDRYNLADEAVRNGLLSVDWPGRLEQVPSGDFLADGWELWLDGGHNVSAAKAVRTQLNKWRDKPLYLVFGMLKRKDSKAYLEQVCDVVDHVYCVGIDGQDAKKPEKLAQKVENANGKATSCKNITTALDVIKTERHQPGRVLVCGSLSLLAAFYELSGRT